MVNNLNDGMVWGLVPLFLTGAGLPLAQVGLVAAVYPGVWGLSQLATGALSDRWGRKRMIAAGMWIQAVGISLFVIGKSFLSWIGASVLLGLGTAMVYPTLLAAVSDVAHPEWRASAVGVYRLWRDGGYAVGALLSGILADTGEAMGLAGIPFAMQVIAVLTFLSGLVVAVVITAESGKLGRGGICPGRRGARRKSRGHPTVERIGRRSRHADRGQPTGGPDGGRRTGHHAGICGSFTRTQG